MPLQCALQPLQALPKSIRFILLALTLIEVKFRREDDRWWTAAWLHSCYFIRDRFSDCCCCLQVPVSDSEDGGTAVLPRAEDINAPLRQVKVVCGMLQRRLSRVASDDNCTRALATGGDWTIVTYFRFRAQHRMWNTNNQKLVESDENESKENFHSSPEDVKNFKLNTLNAKWLYLTIFTNWKYVLSAVFL